MKSSLQTIVLLFSIICYGQWTENYNNNTLITNSITEDIQAIGTDDGKTYVIYWDETNGENEYILKLQLLDQDGNQMFGADGMVLNDTAPMNTFTLQRDQAVDAEGNLYISFTATGSEDGYLHKISQTGQQLFGEEGINIGQYGYGTKLATTQDGGVIIGWENKISKYDSSGNMAWDEPLEIAPPSAGLFTYVADIQILSDDSFIVIYHVMQSQWTSYSNLWATRFSADRDKIWTHDVQLSDQTTQINKIYSLLMDNQENIYYGYYGSTGTRFDSFVQKLNADGTIPWGINGASIRDNDAFYELNTSIALEPNSSYIWATSIVSNHTQSENGQYIQKIDKQTGERLFSENAKAIFPVSSDNWISTTPLQLVNNKPLFLFTNGITNGITPVQLGVSLLDENGEFAWEEEHRFIATSNFSKSFVGFTKNIEGQSIAVWSEDRGDGYKAYAQNILIEDNMGVDESDYQNIKIYPNPVKDFLGISNGKNITEISVFNLAGQKIMSFTEIKNQQINLSSLGTGNYIIRIKTASQKIETFKIVKK